MKKIRTLYDMPQGRIFGYPKTSTDNALRTGGREALALDRVSGFRHCFNERKTIGWALKYGQSMRIPKW